MIVATNQERYMEQPLPFGQWLLTQQDKPGLIGQLATGAAADRRFPRAGDVGVVRQHLSTMQADGDMFAALEDAETDWLCM
jgi:hypothetical protein